MIKWGNKGKVVLLAGSTGYIGKSVLNELLREGFNIICIARENTIEGCQKNDHRALKIFNANICNFEEINKILDKFGKVDLIISCLGSRHGTEEEANEVEFGANNNLLKIGKKLNIKQFILLSAVCVQKPSLLFQKAKLKFENALINSGINYTIVRPTAFFKSISGQIRRVKNGKRFLVFDSGTNTKCKPISERNLSQFIRTKILNKNAYDQIFVIGGPGPAVSLKEQGELLFKLTKLTPKFFYFPSAFFKLAAYLISPVAVFSRRAMDCKEFLHIAYYYATESMLVWDNEKKQYDDLVTPEFGKDTLEAYYERSLSNPNVYTDLADKKLFR